MVTVEVAVCGEVLQSDGLAALQRLPALAPRLVLGPLYRSVGVNILLQHHSGEGLLLGTPSRTSRRDCAAGPCGGCNH